MTTRTETRRIRLAQWHKIFQQKAESGLTAKEFCAINNISRDAHFYWQNLVRLSGGRLWEEVTANYYRQISLTRLCSVNYDRRISAGTLQIVVALF